MLFRCVLVATMSLTLPASVFAQGSGTVDKRERPDYERRVSEFTVTMTALGTIASIADGVVEIEVAAKRFQSRPDQGTKFTADKKTTLSGRRDLKLDDFFVGAPVKLTFVAETGKLLEMRLRYERPKAAAGPVR